MKIGIGFDVHQFAVKRELILGGVHIPYAKGLLGHSDADVLLHALMDAILGALALGDIGQHFPDTDQRYQGINSRQLLKEVQIKMNQAGYQIGNIDAVIMAQSPKMAPHIPQIRSNIAEDLLCLVPQVSIKATTTEHLGFVGRKEGIAAQCVVLLQPL